MINRLTDTLNFQSEALSLRSERQRMLASNIANADTPGYVAREMDFAQVLREATGRASAVPLQLSTTASAHMNVDLIAQRETRLGLALPSQSSADANSVDMDRERASFADNSVKYEATLRFINGQVRTMLDAVKGQQ